MGNWENGRERQNNSLQWGIRYTVELRYNQVLL
jgi:hypothetical protein